MRRTMQSEIGLFIAPGAHLAADSRHRRNLLERSGNRFLPFDVRAFMAGSGFHAARKSRAGWWESNSGDRVDYALWGRPGLVGDIPPALRELGAHPQRGRVAVRRTQGRIGLWTTDLAGDVAGRHSAAGAPAPVVH